MASEGVHDCVFTILEMMRDRDVLDALQDLELCVGVQRERFKIACESASQE